MAKLFLITYDLKAPGQNYSDLYDAIKSIGDWQHPLESMWVVRTCDDKTASGIKDTIRAAMDKGDRLYVVDITGQDYSGWLAKSFWTWYKEE